MVEPSPPEGTVVTDDAELAVALDAADRAAWALRDAETLLFARLVPSLDTALDILRSYESQLAATRWRIQVEAFLAKGP